MQRIKLLLVFGTRPEAIKMAPVVHALKQEPCFEVRVCVTGQHRQMLDQVLTWFNIVPDYDLNIMSANQSLTQLHHKIMHGLESVFADFKPHRILVHGDTATTFAASLAAFYHKIAIAHVEAGLRTKSLEAPWPEEANRRLTTVLADLHFAPTDWAKDNLLRAQVPPNTVYVTGNTVIDALFSTLVTIKASLVPQLQVQLSCVSNAKQQQRKILLVTGHRRENHGQGILDLCQALLHLVQHYPVTVVYPVHLSPQVNQPVRELLSNNASIHLLDPLDYVPFVYLMQQSDIILTDSGGIQEEAPSLGKPVLVMRETTERPEGVAAGVVRLVGTQTQSIINAVSELLNQNTLQQQMSQAANPYGDGQAAQCIVTILKQSYGIANTQLLAECALAN